MSAGIAYLPEDRHQEGLVLDFSIAENVPPGVSQSHASCRVSLCRRLKASRASEMSSYVFSRPSGATGL